MVDAGGDQLLCQRDTAVHAFEMTPPQAVATRRRVLDWTATDRLRVIGYHLPYPGFGHVARNGNGYRWVPGP